MEYLLKSLLGSVIDTFTSGFEDALDSNDAFHSYWSELFL